MFPIGNMSLKGIQIKLKVYYIRESTWEETYKENGKHLINRYDNLKTRNKQRISRMSEIIILIDRHKEFD